MGGKICGFGLGRGILFVELLIFGLDLCDYKLKLINVSIIIQKVIDFDQEREFIYSMPTISKHTQRLLLRILYRLW